MIATDDQAFVEKKILNCAYAEGFVTGILMAISAFLVGGFGGYVILRVLDKIK